jgi:Na+-transporting NADH:ubiquinone oxidoreductase subunit NqrE
MALLIAAIVVIGFSRTVNQNLFHAAIPRPFLLWIHAAAFSGWICFYILQSALVRSRNLKLHRQLGWIGAGLGALMVPLGITIAIIMGGFDSRQLHQYDPTFLSIPFYDMIAFGTLFRWPSIGAESPICTGRFFLWRPAVCSTRPSAVLTSFSITTSFSPASIS